MRDHKKNRQPSHGRDKKKPSTQKKVQGEKQNSPVFSFISHKTLKRAGFILWQFSACFLQRWTGHHFASALKQVATATKPRQSYKMSPNPPQDATLQWCYSVLFKSSVFVSHQDTTYTEKKMPHFSNHSNTVLHVAPQLWHASNVNSTSCSIMSHDTYRRGSATRLLLTM